MGVLEVEASRFQATEQGFHLPAVGIGVEGFGLGYAGGGDEEVSSDTRNCPPDDTEN